MYIDFLRNLTQFYINFVETGTSDWTLMGLDQLLKCSGFSLYPFSFQNRKSIQIPSFAAGTMKPHGKFSRGGDIYPPPSRHLLLLVSWCSVCINQSEYFLDILQYLFHLIAAINIYKGIQTTFNQGWIHEGKIKADTRVVGVFIPPPRKIFLEMTEKKNDVQNVPCKL